MKPEHEAILLANAIVAEDLAERGELVVSNHLVRMENSIRELSAEVVQVRGWYEDWFTRAFSLLEFVDETKLCGDVRKAAEEAGAKWEAMKAERDQLAGLAQEAIDWGLNVDKGYDLLRATATKSALKAALAQAG